MHNLDDYREIAGSEVISAIYGSAMDLHRKRVLHISSTHYGGGMAEILDSLVPLMNSVGIETDWRIFNGSPDLFTVTKKFHNALQGDSKTLSEREKQLYLVRVDKAFSPYYKSVTLDTLDIDNPNRDMDRFFNYSIEDNSTEDIKNYKIRAERIGMPETHWMVWVQTDNDTGSLYKSKALGGHRTLPSD